jgi:two-component system, NtrC family, sensor histidine kinase HydH
VALVSRTVDDFQRIQGDEHTVPLRLHVGAELAGEPRWLVDADALGRILANLLRNAVQAMSGGPRPLRADEAVQVRLERRGGELELAVIDAGPGIPSEILPSVFDEFFTTRSEGTGLGLAIVSRLVEQHRGCVTFSSTPGRGTRVVVRIPP